eukprot:g77191.t1
MLAACTGVDALAQRRNRDSIQGQERDLRANRRGKDTGEPSGTDDTTDLSHRSRVLLMKAQLARKDDTHKQDERSRRTTVKDSQRIQGKCEEEGAKPRTRSKRQDKENEGKPKKDSRQSHNLPSTKEEIAAQLEADHALALQLEEEEVRLRDAQRSRRQMRGARQAIQAEQPPVAKTESTESAVGQRQTSGESPSGTDGQDNRTRPARPAAIAAKAAIKVQSAASPAVVQEPQSQSPPHCPLLLVSLPPKLPRCLRSILPAPDDINYERSATRKRAGTNGETSADGNSSSSAARAGFGGVWSFLGLDRAGRSARDRGECARLQHQHNDSRSRQAADSKREAEVVEDEDGEDESMPHRKKKKAGSKRVIPDSSDSDDDEPLLQGPSKSPPTTPWRLQPRETIPPPNQASYRKLTTKCPSKKKATKKAARKGREEAEQFSEDSEDSDSEIEELQDDVILERHRAYEVEERRHRLVGRNLQTWAICDDSGCAKWRKLSRSWSSDRKYYCGERSAPNKRDCSKLDDWIVGCVGDQAAQSLSEVGIDTVVKLESDSSLRKALHDQGYYWDKESQIIQPFSLQATPEPSCPMESELVCKRRNHIMPTRSLPLFECRHPYSTQELQGWGDVRVPCARVLDTRAPRPDTVASLYEATVRTGYQCVMAVSDLYMPFTTSMGPNLILYFPASATKGDNPYGANRLNVFDVPSSVEVTKYAQPYLQEKQRVDCVNQARILLQAKVEFMTSHALAIVHLLLENMRYYLLEFPYVYGQDGRKHQLNDSEKKAWIEGTSEGTPNNEPFMLTTTVRSIEKPATNLLLSWNECRDYYTVYNWLLQVYHLARLRWNGRVGITQRKALQDLGWDWQLFFQTYVESRQSTDDEATGPQFSICSPHAQCFLYPTSPQAFQGKKEVASVYERVVARMQSLFTTYGSRDASQPKAFVDALACLHMCKQQPEARRGG